MIILVYIIFIVIFIYALLKEREELGCYRVSIEKQCDDNKSVYVINTKATETDNKEELYNKLESILSYHEKAGVWRRCYILSTILLFILYIIKNTCNKDVIYYWINLLLLYFTVLYFFFNYINYHHFRNLKNNGLEIIKKLKIIYKE